MYSGRFLHGESPDGKGMDKKMQQPYDFFKSKYEFRGKHARMVDELCSIKEVENNYFRRVMDVYLMAAIVGFRIDRKAAVDYFSDDTKNIFADVMLKEKDTLDFLMQTMAILENAKSMNSKESIMKVFRGPQTREEFIVLDTMFHDYVRGGVEELYEQLIVRKPEPEELYRDEETANLMELLEKLRTKQTGAGGAGKMQE